MTKPTLISAQYWMGTWFLRLYWERMKLILSTLTLLTLLIVAGCQTTIKDVMNSSETQSFFIGTYTDGESLGIYKYALHADGSLSRIGLAVMSNNPSFLALSADKKFLIAVNEINDNDGVGSVESYLVSADSLKLLNRKSSGGAHPCFVAVNTDGFVLTANYTGGNVGLLQLDDQGLLSDILDVQQHSGQGTTTRQAGPHAHSAWFNPIDNSIISIDLGTNELWFSSVDPHSNKFHPSEQEKLQMGPGDGPRHLAFHPNGKWLYVVNELTSTVSKVERNDAGIYRLESSVSALPAGYSEPNTCADIHISSDGNFVYASNRGHNSIAVFNVDAGDGSLKLKGNKACGGEGPRNFAFSPDENFILVANQHSNNIVSLRRDRTTGLLKYVSQTEAPTPVCIVF